MDPTATDSATQGISVEWIPASVPGPFRHHGAETQLTLASADPGVDIADAGVLDADVVDSTRLSRARRWTGQVPASPTTAAFVTTVTQAALVGTTLHSGVAFDPTLLRMTLTAPGGQQVTSAVKTTSAPAKAVIRATMALAATMR